MGTFSTILWDFPGCIAFTPPPPLCNFFFFFLKRELSPLHHVNTCCAPPTASGSLKTGTGWPFLPSSSSTPTSTCHLPLFPHYHVPFLLLRPSSLSRRAWPSVGCYWAGISQTLPLRPVTSSAGRKSEGSSSSCESNPTHLCVFDSGEGRALRGHGGVESPCLRVSHYQTMPHHHCLHMAIGFGLRYSGSRTISVEMLLNPGVPTSWALSSCTMAVEQCGGRDQIRKERSEEEGAFNKWRKTFVYLTINGQRCSVHMTNNRQRPPCPPLHQGVIINLKHQGHTNWLVAFSLRWVNDLDCLSVPSCQSTVASTNDISGNIIQHWFSSWRDTPTCSHQG